MSQDDENRNTQDKAAPRSDANSGDGWGTTHTPNGDIHHYDPDQFGGGSGNSGGSSGGSSGSGSSTPSPPKPSYLSAGALMAIPAGGYTAAEGLAIPLGAESLSSAAARGLAIAAELRNFTAVGIVVYSLTPTVMGKGVHEVTFIPVESILADKVNTLTEDINSAMAKARVVPVPNNGKLDLTIVGGGKPVSVPVVHARKTAKQGVYQATLPGVGTLNLTPDTTATTKPAESSPGVTSVQNAPIVSIPLSALPPVVNAIVRFPSSGGSTRAVYVSVVTRPDPDQLKKQEEEQAARIKQWRETHPYGAAAMDWKLAQYERSIAEKVEQTAKDRYQKASDAWATQVGIDITTKRAEYQKLDAEMHRLEIIKAGALNSGNAFMPGSREFAAFRYATGEQAKIRGSFNTVRLAVEKYDSTKKEFEDSQKALAEAMEARKAAGEKEKKAKEKTEAEKAREAKGKITGSGEKGGDDKIHDKKEIPDWIADKLRGEECNGFDDLRKKIWLEVAKNPKAMEEFDEKQQEELRKGKSPKVPDEKKRVGKREKYEIHHKKFIKDGGPPLDLDNLIFVTPRTHIDLHKKR